MPHELESLRDQMNRLERQLRLLKIVAAVLAALAITFALTPRPSAQRPESMRVRQLIVEDADGRSRVVLGPRERISLVADEKGGAHVRFLDRRTSVVSRMYLDEQNRAWLSFTDFQQTPALIRRYGLSGEEVLRPPAP